ncbi:MAG: phosphoribosylaminoimidazolesuccinocarboxamide synthase [Chloroflexi bacterium]|uniref:Phosphoribosylaminoimidazole-succinocarboxamide synthase n=1 Tax=Candidatus Chlorohelix allophototropha TaxID=3003348 RepID=A0A8T7M3L9_9CHLR|nr:phosphoribosylaminoimidazolesuccinocarboxamide synthase [Chloroflexota bacterium]WJW65696.1 phosphoribosylaminoimidazolesuccinocarboxamide synthase [Chloroflexota bacterium L227-S17]
MYSAEIILEQRTRALSEINLNGFGQRHQGKVRDFYSLPGNRRLLVTTDRQSAFDRILGQIPFKGQVLNQLSQFWFEQSSDILPNHMLSVPDPNVMLAREAQMFPVEIVVRGYMTGVTDTSIWTMYQKGSRQMYGYNFKDGMYKNQPLATPIITPTTHAELGGHDKPLSRTEIIESGLVAEEIYTQIEEKALALFARGQELCGKGGLILVDTKYEFGLIDGQVAITDEVHTPDSSRFWIASTYESRLGQGQEPENFDKELLRLWMRSKGFGGDGAPPALDEDIIARLSQRYIGCYERITGREFESDLTQPVAERIKANLEGLAL